MFHPRVTSALAASVLLLLGCEKPSVETTEPIGIPSYPTSTPLPTIKPAAPSPSPAGWLKVESDRWERAIIRPEKKHFVDAIAAQITRNKTRYVAVAQKSHVPWQVIGAIHSLEASLDFRSNLANGDPLTARTRHVPAGRPPTGNPPFTWEFAAEDSLLYDHMGTKDWSSVSHNLLNVETYNGAGYLKFHPAVPTPYLWSWTTVYTRGKYIEDGQWSSTAVSQQCGAASILKLLPP